MHYYQRHLGDYSTATPHLSMLEHGAYTKLLDYYYTSEAPIPDSLCERIAGASTASDRKAVRAVLEQFFTLEGGQWRSKRADEEIAAFRAKSLKAKESAEARWMRTHSDRTANAMLSVNQEPVSKKEQEQKTTPRAASSISRPDDVPDQVWQDWIDLRKAKKAKVTKTALDGIKREAAKAGLSLTQALEMCCARGWQGFNADWVAQEARPRGSPAQAQPGKRMQAIMRLEAMKNGLGSSGSNHGDSETLLLGTGPGAGFGTGGGGSGGVG